MEFIDDLKALNTLSKEQLDVLVKEININPLTTVADFGKYDNLCKENNIDGKLGISLYYVLSYVFGYASDEKDLKNGLNRLEKEIEPYLMDLKEIWNYIKDIIPKLTEFQTSRKEKVLTKLFNHLESFSVICEMRPIFDLKRENILKYTYPIILSLKANNSEERSVFELSEIDLLDIKMEIDTAVNKLEHLKHVIEHK